MLGNWIQQTTTTTGTGNLTLSTVTNYPAFSSQFASGQRFQYQILDDTTGAPIESGIGYLSGGALVRERIECTMVSGTFDNTSPSAVTLAAGTKRVICAASMASVSGTAAGIFAPSGGFSGHGDTSMVLGSGGTYTLSPSRAFVFSYACQSSQEIDAVVCRVTVAGSGGSLIRGAVYSISSAGLPDVQLAQSGTLAGDTTGQKILTFTPFRPPQRFFIAFISTGSPGLFAAPSGSSVAPLGFLSDMSPLAMIAKDGVGTTFPSVWTPPDSQTVIYDWRPVTAIRCV